MSKFVKSIALFALMAAIACGCVGCGTDHNVENQAYVVLLGVDSTDGGIELTIQSPKISAGGEYLTISAKGAGFQSALDALELATPRYLNLSQLSLFIVSEDIAKSEYMATVLELQKSNYRIYNAAYFAVCEGKAKDFIKAQKPVIGERLSTGVDAMLESYQELGYIPLSTLAEMYYRSESVFSDPLAILCAEAKGGDASNAPGDVLPGEFGMESENKNMFMGAALMADGRMVGKLTGMQTVFVNLIKGEADGFSYTASGAPVQLVLLKKPNIDISIADSRVSVKISIKMSALALEGGINMDEVSAALKADMLETLKLCQESGVEPFGFAEIAARGFSTISNWRDFNWREKFRDARIDIHISLTPVA